MSSYYVDPNPKVPAAFQSSPEYQNWLKKTFPLPSNSSFKQEQPKQQQPSSSSSSSNNMSLMIISQHSSSSSMNDVSNSKNNSASVASAQDIKNFVISSGANVIVNEKAFSTNTDNASSDEGTTVKTVARNVTLDDFNTAFYKKKQELLRIQKEKAKKKEEMEKRQQEQEQQQQKLAPQRRSEREEDDDTATTSDENKNNDRSKAEQQQQQQQAQTPSLSGSGVFALPDHLGRSFLHTPLPLASSEIKKSQIQQQQSNNNNKLHKLPMKLSHAYKTNNSAAITSLSWVPPHAHLAIAGDVTGTLCIYEAISSSASSQSDISTAKVRTEKLAQYSGFHKSTVTDVSFPACDAAYAASSVSGTLQSSSSEKFLSSSIDRDHPLCLWDTERAQIITEYHLSEKWYSKFVSDAGCGAVSFVPPGVHSGATRGDTLCASAFGKTIVVWDTRSAGRVADLEAHHLPVAHLRFVQHGRGLISCGQDKTVRLWDLRSTSAVQEFSHAQMHAITNVIEHPWTGEVLAQSNDDRIRCMIRLGKNKNVRNIPFRPGHLEIATSEYLFAKDGLDQQQQQKSLSSTSTGNGGGRDFKGHKISGTGCKIGLSRTDGGQVVSSGDVFGNLFMWSYYQNNNNNNNNNKSNNEDGSDPSLMRKFRAHGKELTVHDWHPVVPGLILTGGKDGQLKCFK